VEEAAQGILDVANANMERALRVVSVERGHDPREFGLVAFGGAGPLHAPKLAAELDVPRVLVPRTAGVLSALGLLVSDVAYDYSTSRVRPWAEVTPADLESEFDSFEQEGRDRLADEGFEATAGGFGDTARFERAVDLRYRGQSFDLTVSVPEGDLTDEDLDAVADRFHEAHERRYGHASPDEPLELVTVRLRARGEVEPPTLDPAATGGSAEDAIREERTVVYDGDPNETRIYDRSRLPADAEFEGPAVVEGPESTVVIHPGQRASVDEYGNILVET
jgi:N-methylhydantoinase A